MQSTGRCPGAGKGGSEWTEGLDCTEYAVLSGQSSCQGLARVGVLRGVLILQHATCGYVSDAAIVNVCPPQTNGSLVTDIKPYEVDGRFQVALVDVESEA